MNKVADLETGEAHSTFLLNENGSVTGDLILYRLGEEGFLLLGNAAKVLEEESWLDKHLSGGVTLYNESDDWAGPTVQGPDASQTFRRSVEDRSYQLEIVSRISFILVIAPSYAEADTAEKIALKASASIRSLLMGGRTHRARDTTLWARYP